MADTAKNPSRIWIRAHLTSDEDDLVDKMQEILGKRMRLPGPCKRQALILRALRALARELRTAWEPGDGPPPLV